MIELPFFVPGVDPSSGAVLLKATYWRMFPICQHASRRAELMAQAEHISKIFPNLCNNSARMIYDYMIDPTRRWAGGLAN